MYGVPLHVYGFHKTHCLGVEKTGHLFKFALLVH